MADKPLLEKPKPAEKPKDPVPTKKAAAKQVDSDSDPWGAWSDNEEIDPSRVDY